MSAPVYRCIGRTEAGKPCRRIVGQEGIRCYAHGGPQGPGRNVGACTVEGCGRPRESAGRCKTHHRRLVDGHPDPDGPIQPYGAISKQRCSLEHCHRPAQVTVEGRVVCSSHYRRHRIGHPEWDAPLRTTYRAHQPRSKERKPMVAVFLAPGTMKDLEHLADVRMLSMSRLASELLEELISRAKTTAEARKAAAEAIEDIGWVQRPDAWEGR